MSSSADASTVASRLLKSWATPPASCPTASSRCERSSASCSSACWFVDLTLSVTSLARPSHLPRLALVDVTERREPQAQVAHPAIAVAQPQRRFADLIRRRAHGGAPSARPPRSWSAGSTSDASPPSAATTSSGWPRKSCRFSTSQVPWSGSNKTMTSGVPSRIVRNRSCHARQLRLGRRAAVPGLRRARGSRRPRRMHGRVATGERDGDRDRRGR